MLLFFISKSPGSYTPIYCLHEGVDVRMDVLRMIFSERKLLRCLPNFLAHGARARAPLLLKGSE